MRCASRPTTTGRKGIGVKKVSRFDLNLLAVFEAIYSRGGVTQAARHLNLSQSAISHALGRLRQAFGDELFVRMGNGLVPTALSRSIIDPVRDVVREFEVATARASGFDPAASTRQFRVGLRQASETRLFAALVRRVADEAPEISLASVNFRRSDFAAALAHGDLDVAIDVPSAGAAGLRAQLLQHDPLVVAARHGHPLIDGTLDLETFVAARHVMATARSSGPGAEDRALAEIGEERHIAVRCQHVWTAWQIVAESDLILTLLASHAAALQRVAALQILPLPVAVQPGAFQLFWHAASERDPGSLWLRDLIIRHFAELGPRGT